MPRRRAASARENFWSVTKRIAARLNSAVKVRRTLALMVLLVSVYHLNRVSSFFGEVHFSNHHPIPHSLAVAARRFSAAMPTHSMQCGTKRLVFLVTG
jgi:hypothetical protein